MGEERTRILNLVAEGKITAEEAARLLDAMEARGTQTAVADPPTRTGSAGLPKFMYVKVVSAEGDNVNVKIPLSLVRAGLKLTSLIPPQAMEQINKQMAAQRHGDRLRQPQAGGHRGADRVAARDGGQRRLKERRQRARVLRVGLLREVRAVIPRRRAARERA